MTIEQIDKHIEKVQPKAVTKKNLSAKANQRIELSVIWEQVKPVIIFAKGLLFFKPKWKKVIAAFVAAMDAYIQVEPTETDG